MVTFPMDRWVPCNYDVPEPPEIGWIPEKPAFRTYASGAIEYASSPEIAPVILPELVLPKPSEMDRILDNFAFGTSASGSMEFASSVDVAVPEFVDDLSTAGSMRLLERDSQTESVSVDNKNPFGSSERLNVSNKKSTAKATKRAFGSSERVGLNVSIKKATATSTDQNE
jgi:hypothetical protein